MNWIDAFGITWLLAYLGVHLYAYFHRDDPFWHAFLFWFPNVLRMVRDAKDRETEG